jgi:hypothetical protein
MGFLKRLWERLTAHPAAPSGARSSPAPATAGMVRELLDPTFLRAQFERIHDQVGSPVPEDEYQRALAELDERQAALAAPQASAPRPDAAFMPRHPALSMLQSLLETCIESRADELLRELEPGEKGFPTHALVDPNLYEQFGPCDITWVQTKLAEAWQLLEGRPPFRDKPADPVRVANNLRLIVVGDWGSGLPSAVNVGTQMRAVVEDGRRSGRSQHVIHLGDVYYSGWAEEYDKRFLSYWPVRAGERDVGSWSLNGNHDMYSGGHGYFGHLLRDPRFAAQQQSSYFSLENDHWQILGLDTGYLDADLDGSQAAWVKNRLQGSPAKALLLSHHQLLSSYNTGVGAKLEARLAEAFAVRPADAWFWGHEHRCALYQPAQHARYPRCIGHGGIPAFVSAPNDPLPDGVQYEYRGARIDGSDRWQLFGFAVLDFDGPEITVRYIDELGDEHHRESIV